MVSIDRVVTKGDDASSSEDGDDEVLETYPKIKFASLSGS